MEIEVCAVGGYGEVGKNMTAVRVGDEVIILDMGLYLPKILTYEEGDPRELSGKELMKIGAIPNDDVITEWHNKVKAIVLGHCHLDHIGAVSYLAEKYNCQVIGTPYTLGVLDVLLDERQQKLKKITKLNSGSSIKISENIKIEFINVTHSTLQCVLIAVHTPNGVILYCNDFKFDNHPVLGKKPDFQRLREIGNEGVLCLILDSLYSTKDGKTPSEKVAKELLKDVLFGVDNKGKCIVITTFSSHLARLSSIIELGKKLRRKIVFLGRSLHKYVSVAEKLNLVNFRKDVEIIGFADKVKKKLKNINEKNRADYMIVCTGNQGEVDAILSRMAKGDLPWEFENGDHVIFSCKTIPTDMTMRNREILERRLKAKGVRIFADVHVSGHAAREDHRDLINMTKPKHIIPAHGEMQMIVGMVNLANELGYNLGKNIHMMQDGQFLQLE